MREIAADYRELFAVSRSMLVLRGLIFLLLGVFLFFRPVVTLWWVTLCIGAVVLVDGVMMFAASFRHRGSRRGLMIADAVFLVLLGIFALSSPFIADILWVVFVGLWQILSGIQAFFLKDGGSRGWLIFSGILSILLGIFFIFAPFAGLLTLSWVLAIALIISAFSSFAGAWDL